MLLAVADARPATAQPNEPFAPSYLLPVDTGPGTTVLDGSLRHPLAFDRERAYAGAPQRSTGGAGVWRPASRPWTVEQRLESPAGGRRRRGSRGREWKQRRRPARRGRHAAVERRSRLPDRRCAALEHRLAGGGDRGRRDSGLAGVRRPRAVAPYAARESRRCGLPSLGIDSSSRSPTGRVVGAGSAYGSGCLGKARSPAVHRESWRWMRSTSARPTTICIASGSPTAPSTGTGEREATSWERPSPTCSASTSVLGTTSCTLSTGRNGARRWRRPLPGRPADGPLRVGPVLVVAGISPNVDLFDAETGLPRGRYLASGELATMPHVIADARPPLPHIILATGTGNVIGLGAAAGPPRLPFGLPFEPFLPRPTVLSLSELVDWYPPTATGPVPEPAAVACDAPDTVARSRAIAAAAAAALTAGLGAVLEPLRFGATRDAGFERVEEHVRRQFGNLAQTLQRTAVSLATDPGLQDGLDGNRAALVRLFELTRDAVPAGAEGPGGDRLRRDGDTPGPGRGQPAELPRELVLLRNRRFTWLPVPWVCASCTWSRSRSPAPESDRRARIGSVSTERVLSGPRRALAAEDGPSPLASPLAPLSLRAAADPQAVEPGRRRFTLPAPRRPTTARRLGRGRRSGSGPHRLAEIRPRPGLLPRRARARRDRAARVGQGAPRPRRPDGPGQHRRGFVRAPCRGHAAVDRGDPGSGPDPPCSRMPSTLPFACPGLLRSPADLLLLGTAAHRGRDPPRRDSPTWRAPRGATGAGARPAAAC